MSTDTVRVEGWLDAITQDSARGWAWNPDQPDGRVVVELLCDGVVIGQATADVTREDLKLAGVGDGRHGFEIPWTCPHQDGAGHVLTARERESGVTLFGSGKSYVSTQIANAFAPIGQEPSSAAVAAWTAVAADIRERAVMTLKGPQGPALGVMTLGAVSPDAPSGPVLEATLSPGPEMVNRRLEAQLLLRASRPVSGKLVVEAYYGDDMTPTQTQSTPLTLDRVWRPAALDVTPVLEERPAGPPRLLRFVVEADAPPSGTLIELGAATLGDDDAQAGPGAAAPAKSSDTVAPARPRPDSAFATANRLTPPMLAVKGGCMELAKPWRCLIGRGGRLALSYESTHVAARPRSQSILPQPAIRLNIAENEHYFRLALRLDVADCLKVGKFEVEFVARCVTGAINIQSYMIFEGPDLVQNGKAVKQAALAVGGGVHPTQVWSAISRSVTLDKATLDGLAKARTCDFILQFVGVGEVEIYAPWAGRRPTPANGLAALWNPLKQFDYDRFIDGSEAVDPTDPTERCGVVFVCPPDMAGASDIVAREVGEAIREARRSVSRALVLVPSRSFDLAAFRNALGQRLSKVQASRIEVACVDDADGADAHAALRTFAAALPPAAPVVCVEVGDRLKSDFASVLSQATAEFIVFDYDHLSPDGRRERPRLAPGLSPHLLLETDYVDGAVAVRASRFAQMEVTPIRREAARAAIFRALSGAAKDRVEKVDGILVNRARASRKSVPDDLRFAREMTAELGRKAEVRDRGNRVSVRYRADGAPLVSIIILFRDKVDFLQALVESIVSVSTYANYEMILVDNQSREPETLAYLDSLRADPRVRLVRFDAAFNYSKMNNFGAAQARGDYLIFMNNDMRVVTPDWIETLIGYAALPDTAFVGAKLHFANGRIQHAGVVVGLKGLAGHALDGQHDVACAPELAMHSRDVSAVTGALMAVSRVKFDWIGPFDERFIVTGNDVEICLRALRRGLRNVMLGDIQVFHYEKTTRSAIPVKGYDIVLSLETYEPYLSQGDPYWNRVASLTRSDGFPLHFGQPDSAARKAEARMARAQALRARKTGEDVGFIASNNLRLSNIADVKKANEAYAARKDKRIGSVAWLLPMVDHIYRGGVFTAFRFAAASYRDHGARQHVVICSDRAPDLDKIRGQLAEAFPDVPFEVTSLDPERGDRASLPRTDAAVATLWTTAYILAEYPCNGRFYLVQDYEPLFLAEHSGYGLIQTTYQMGLFPICNSQGVADAIRPYADVTTLVFNPAVDRAMFRPRVEPKPAGAPVRIVFYGRPANRRNIFGMGVQALLEVKQRFGDAVDIVSAGAEFDPKAYGAEGAITNAGLLPSMESVAALYRSSDIGLVFMQSKHPSYQPLEYMASGCVTVTNHNYSNDWLLRDRENCLLSPVTLDAIAETICEAVSDAGLRARLSQAGLATVSGFEWAPVERRVAAFLADPAGVGGRPVARTK